MLRIITLKVCHIFVLSCSLALPLSLSLFLPERNIPSSLFLFIFLSLQLIILFCGLDFSLSLFFFSSLSASPCPSDSLPLSSSFLSFYHLVSLSLSFSLFAVFDKALSKYHGEDEPLLPPPSLLSLPVLSFLCLSSDSLSFCLSPSSLSLSLSSDSLSSLSFFRLIFCFSLSSSLSFCLLIICFSLSASLSPFLPLSFFLPLPLSLSVF